MKYRIISIICILLLLGLSIVTTNTQDNAINKVDTQHLESTNTCAESESIEECSKLPIIMIDTNNKDIPGKERDDNNNYINDTILSNLKIIDNSTGGNHLTDAVSLDESIKIRVRGSSSRSFPKSSYKITFVDENEEAKKVSILGMEKNKVWVLHGPYLDKTLLRNYLWYHISGMMMESAPNSKFVRLYINGEYQGLYLAVEAPTEGEYSRMVVTKSKKSTSLNGYIFHFEASDDDTDKKLGTFGTLTLANKNKYFLSYPSSDASINSLKTAIEKDISYYEKVIYSFDFNSDKYGYENFIDIDSFVDYFIINEFTLNYDAGLLSTYVYKGVDNKFKMYVWDFNNANNNFSFAMKYDSFQLYNSFWYFMLMKNPDFTESIITRYKYLRTNILSDEYLDTYIDEVVEYLGKEIDYNYTLWSSAYTYLKYEDKNQYVNNYDEAITQLKESIHKRGAYLDEYIDTVKQFSNEAKTKKFNH